MLQAILIIQWTVNICTFLHSPIMIIFLYLLFISPRESSRSCCRAATRCVKFIGKNLRSSMTLLSSIVSFCLSLGFFGCGLIRAFQAICLWPIKGAGNRSSLAKSRLDEKLYRKLVRSSPQKYFSVVFFSKRFMLRNR